MARWAWWSIQSVPECSLYSAAPPISQTQTCHWCKHYVNNPDTMTCHAQPGNNGGKPSHRKCHVFVPVITNHQLVWSPTVYEKHSSMLSTDEERENLLQHQIQLIHMSPNLLRDWFIKLSEIFSVYVHVFSSTTEMSYKAWNHQAGSLALLLNIILPF